MASSLELHVRSIVTSRIYPSYADVCAHVLEAWRNFKDMAPRLDRFQMPPAPDKRGGVRPPQDLVTLDGTIPITYKRSTYNIPVQIWLPDAYPNMPPVCFVRPTPDMKIKQSKYVDENGRIYLPYLHEWRFPASDLVGLVSVMVIVFGDEPPVYSKQRGSGGGSSGGARGSNSSEAGSSASTTTNVKTAATASVAPLYSTFSTNSSPNDHNSMHANAAASAYTPWHGNTAASVTGDNSGYPATNAYPSSTAMQPTPSSGAAYNSNTITDEHIHASLVSAVEERIKRRITEVVLQAEAELDALRRTKEELQRGSQRLEQHIEQLDREKFKIDEQIIQLNEKNTELERAIEQMQAKRQQQQHQDGGVDTAIDDAIAPVAPIYQQIMQEYAEMCALEDAIYFLGEALRKKTIDNDTFFDKVRDLSRRQFKCQALLQRCREKAGLPSGV